MSMEDKTLLTSIAILAVTAIYIVALVMNIDGAYLIPIVTVIAGLSGYTVGTTKANNTSIEMG